MPGKKLYPLEKVAGFVGLTRQTLCNWSGCNSGYRLKNGTDKSNAAAAAFIVYHLYGRGRMDVIKKNIDKIKKRYKKLPEIDIIKEEIDVIDDIYHSFKDKKFDYTSQESETETEDGEGKNGNDIKENKGE